MCAKSQVSMVCLVQLELVLECGRRCGHCGLDEASKVPGKSILSFLLMAWYTR